MKKIIMKAAATCVCLAALGMMFVSCKELEDIDGMNNPQDYYSYRAHSNDFEYQKACGPFDAAIKFSVGSDPILGGNDDKVIEACNTCYESLKPQLQGKSGKVVIYKTRHPDGKQKTLKEYKF